MTPPIRQEAEPRGHHFVPRCWLVGFTENGEKDGRLWVTDLSRRKQWPSTPEKTGKIRDFYRFSEPVSDPVIAEKLYSELEAINGPILKALDKERRPPRHDELDELLQFMAFQWGRVPKFRPFILNVLDKYAREKLAESLQSRESWIAGLKEADLDLDSPGANYEAAKAFFESDDWKITADTEWYVEKALTAVDSVLPLLRRRYWGTSFSPKGRFIACDSPVAMEGPRGGQVGFKNAEVVFYPVSRHVFLTGTLVRVERPRFNLKYISDMNTMMMLNAEAQLYSHVLEFSWSDEKQQHQTDWRLFEKGKF